MKVGRSVVGVLLVLCVRVILSDIRVVAVGLDRTTPALGCLWCRMWDSLAMALFALQLAMIQLSWLLVKLLTTLWVAAVLRTLVPVGALNRRVRN